MESLNQETERVELEDQFILRLPPVINNDNDKAMSLNILFSQ
jgi:hypothetical protein